MNHRIAAFLLALACAGAHSAKGASLPDKIRYNRDIRPILSDNCFACHGPDSGQRKAGLRLDVREEALKPAKSGAVAIVPGKPKGSVLVNRIEARDAEDVMPPPESHKKLTAAQKELLKRWIAGGAVYEKHWSFVAPDRPELPKVKRADWPRNGIDHFILSRLEKEKLAPSPETDKVTLIRRVTLDLTGLPPTPPEVDAFLADQSAKAYEKVLDRLLASPHYGERMAVDWLDAARFADSNGYQVDRDREMYAWRDWVISAYNRNLPFDQFTIEQIAGDLLPSPTLEQRIATGFHRNHMMNEEGGVIPEEFLAEYTADRVETTAAIWLGQTFNCTRCHDHKYDPFTQRDYYSLKAFFHNVTEKGLGNYGADIRRNSPPMIKLPAPEIEAKVAAVRQELAEVNASLVKLNLELAGQQALWERRVKETAVKWDLAEPVSALVDKDEAALNREQKTVAVPALTTNATRIITDVKVAASGATAVRVEWLSRIAKSPLAVANVRMFDLNGGTPRLLTVRQIDVDGDLLKQRDAGPATNMLRSTVVTLETSEPLAAGNYRVVLPVRMAKAMTASEVAVSYTTQDKALLVPGNIQTIAKKDSAKRTDAEKKQLAEAFGGKNAEYRTLSERVAALTKQVDAEDLKIPTTLVMEEMKEMRPTFILVRGAYDKPGEAVTPNTPAVLPAMDPAWPRNRLGLAKWLVDPANPLPARVMVNRYWQSVFGTGLVASSEDFGAQGEVPSHRELLDWLATEFVRTGWDVKGMMRLIVTSATYRQSSRLTPQLRQRDPANRLLARAPRFRLQGEFVRDQALAVSGLLVEKIGGPSVKPYHPPGLYEQIVAGKGPSTYVADKGENLYRRSLYTYWKRSVPNPAMLIFDAPFRETCTLRRPRTNTPLQALNLMNDPTYVEAARMLGQRMMREGGETTEQRLAYGFRLVTARMPQAREAAVLSVAFERALREFTTDKEGAAALLKVGETKADEKADAAQLAALTTVASTLLNLDEVIMKE